MTIDNLDQEPLFSVRMTSLGKDNSCVLALSCNHGLCDSAHLAIITEALARACRGEQLLQSEQNLSRDTLLPASLVAQNPSFQPVLVEVGKLLAKVSTTTVHTISYWKFRAPMAICSAVPRPLKQLHVDVYTIH